MDSSSLRGSAYLLPPTAGFVRLACQRALRVLRHRHACQATGLALGPCLALSDAIRPLACHMHNGRSHSPDEARNCCRHMLSRMLTWLKMPVQWCVIPEPSIKHSEKDNANRLRVHAACLKTFPAHKHERVIQAHKCACSPALVVPGGTEGRQSPAAIPELKKVAACPERP